MSVRKNGGYQIIDLSSVTVGTQATISGIYDKAGGNNGKPLMIVTPDDQRVFAEVKAGTNKYVTAYLGADGATYTVEISNANKVDITKQESSSELDGRVDAIEERLDAITLGTRVDLSSYNSESNAYTVPSDGFIHVKVGDSTSNDAGIGTCGGINNMLLYREKGTNGSDTYFSTLVKKGMKLYVTHNSGTGNAFNFIPFV